MTVNLTQSGKELALKNIVGRTFSTNLYAKLYTNNVSLSNSTFLGDIEECQVNGYSPIQLLQSNWTFQDGTASYLTINFNLNEETTIYGHYVTQNDVLLYVEPFGSSIDIDSNGGIVHVDINIGFL